MVSNWTATIFSCSIPLFPDMNAVLGSTNGVYCGGGSGGCIYWWSRRKGGGGGGAFTGVVVWHEGN